MINPEVACKLLNGIYEFARQNEIYSAKLNPETPGLADCFYLTIRACRSLCDRVDRADAEALMKKGVSLRRLKHAMDGMDSLIRKQILRTPEDLNDMVYTIREYERLRGKKGK